MLIDELTDLKGSGVNEKGLYYYDDGIEYYEYLIRTGVGTDASVEKLQDRTWDYIISCFLNM